MRGGCEKVVKNISAAVLCSSISLSAMLAIESSDPVSIIGITVLGERVNRTIAIYTEATRGDACKQQLWLKIGKCFLSESCKKCSIRPVYLKVSCK
jgi:hypothetical protein